MYNGVHWPRSSNRECFVAPMFTTLTYWPCILTYMDKHLAIVYFPSSQVGVAITAPHPGICRTTSLFITVSYRFYYRTTSVFITVRILQYILVYYRTTMLFSLRWSCYLPYHILVYNYNGSCLKPWYTASTFIIDYVLVYYRTTLLPSPRWSFCPKHTRPPRSLPGKFCGRHSSQCIPERADQWCRRLSCPFHRKTRRWWCPRTSYRIRPQLARRHSWSGQSRRHTSTVKSYSSIVDHSSCFV